MRPNILKRFVNLTHIPIWLFVLLLGVIILRIPNFFEPYSYGDETIYLTLGQGIRKGVTLYKDLHDNKPPLLYITAAVAGNLFWFKAFLLLTGLACITIFNKFSEKIFPRIKSFAFAATFVFALLTTLPFLEGNIANAENFMIFFSIAAFYILIFKKTTYKNIFFAGILFSFSSLFKVPAIFDFPAIIFYWIISEGLSKKGLYTILKRTTILVSGIFVPILISFVYYTLKGAFKDYLIAAYLQNFGYLSSWRPDSQKASFIVKNAPLLIRFGMVLIFNFILYLLRKRIDKKYLFISSWLSFTLFATTLSERPYPHYLLQSSAPLSLLLGLLFTSKSMLQSYSVFPITIFLFVPLFYRYWHYRSFDYYSKILNLATGKIDRTKYLSSFGSRTIPDYDIAAVVKRLTNINDRIFVWEDSSQIYALSDRLPPIKYTSGYHINDFSSIESVVEKLNSSKPKVVVIFPSANPPDVLMLFVKNNYLMYKETDSYQIWKYAGDYARFVIQQ